MRDNQIQIVYLCQQIKVPLLGIEFFDSRIVEKSLVRAIQIKIYEASVAILENTKDPNKITLTEVLHAHYMHKSKGG